ncbi:unnamed protein product [Periconia digitata]|uniref:Uncharacterized protein n=1 Tax=Periconia digitata TaxID=1303443 RepID=A0A9W4XEW0_9PLEO|nr:unnamed protein product [Periconia digitata]
MHAHVQIPSPTDHHKATLHLASRCRGSFPNYTCSAAPPSVLAIYIHREATRPSHISMPSSTVRTACVLAWSEKSHTLTSLTYNLLS